MDLLFNELSLHEQFSDINSFRQALGRLMAMRRAARRFGREMSCPSHVLDATPIPGVRMRQAIVRLSDLNQRRATLAWLNRTGPFWDALRFHSSAEFLECNGEVVTDSSVGEAAYRKLHGSNCVLVSITPSDWMFSPVVVVWLREGENLENLETQIENWLTPDELEAALLNAVPPVTSWDDVKAAGTTRFTNLAFADACFEPLIGIPFAKSAADRFLVLLDILDRFAQSFDQAGRRTPEGHQIYKDYFMGENALFSDSSDREKRDFRDNLTFPYPGRPGDSLYCTWHGKVRHMTLRLHFSWPIEAARPVYVVYAGPKITKR